MNTSNPSLLFVSLTVEYDKQKEQLRMIDFINPDLTDYCYDHTSQEPAIAQEVRKMTEEELEYSNMLSGKLTGQLLEQLIELSGAQKVLEIGCFTGYSALRMAAALPDDGSLITCDYNERYEKLARSAFGRSEHGDKITLKMGKALQTIPELDGPFDLMFLDADKANYPNYYELLLPKLAQNGLLVVDNVLWSGRVLKPKVEQNHQTKGIDELNKMIAADQNVAQVMLPISDGLTLARKK